MNDNNGSIGNNSSSSDTLVVMYTSLRLDSYDLCIDCIALCVSSILLYWDPQLGLFAARQYDHGVRSSKKKS